MKQNLSNSGKKEARQFNQVLDKQVKEGHQRVRGTESRTTPATRKTRGQKVK